MRIGDTEIEDTFAEAFRMVYARLDITAFDQHWLDAATRSICGYGTSVIGCDAEVGLERMLAADETLDGRVGGRVMMFGFSREKLSEAISQRVGQCVMTCPTTAVFGATLEEGVPAVGEPAALGSHLRFFGDGFQKSKLIDGRRFWRVPVMDGEFVVEESVEIAKGIAGGNFLIQSIDQAAGLTAARRAVEAIQLLPQVITPFPGGVVRSGSKVGSRYSKLRASTNDAYCPTLRGRTQSHIHPQANCVYEIVIDGTDEPAIAYAMRVGIEAACGDGIPAISAGNYGGKLGKFLFHLRQVMA